MSRTSRALLGWLMVAGSVAAGVATFAPAAAQDEPVVTAQSQVGETIYANQCAACHGADGRGREIPGTDDVAPALAGNPDVTVPYVDLTVRVGRMPPPENDPYDNRARHVTVTDEEREALVAHLAEEYELEGEIPQPATGDAARGREIYAANCAQCHGSTGAGGVAGGGAWTPPVVGRGDVAVAEAIRVGPFEMPGFAEEQISDQELGDVVAFLDFLAAEHGTPLGLVELNPVFASGFAFLFALVVLVSTLWIAGRPTMFPDVDAEADDRPEDVT